MASWWQFSFRTLFRASTTLKWAILSPWQREWCHSIWFLISFQKMLVLLTFNKGNMVFHFEWGYPVKNLKHMNHLKTLTMVSMETKVVSRDSFWTSFQKKFTWMDSEKGNRVFARGAQCAPPPPWFLEPKKSLVWIGLRHHYRARNWTFDENHFLVSS